ncbi:hypothetical protein [Herbaspirillum huttiense]|uniref:hypothetical protein n=1 Tax=Herbaspirillum huttiense TaxID=863372 RepID=UPI002176D0C5|nr:hypothetical protein [Herbaspirillum huttiense]UWE18059.1 hypothetical protein NY669_07765 [Herbaspirillum huttiense]
MTAPVDYDQLMRALETATPEARLQIIQKYLKSISDPQQRKFVETLLLTGQEIGRREEAKHIVVCLHGIRTRAPWQERLRSELRVVAPHLEVVPMGYGDYPLVRFLALRGSRTEVVEHIRSQLVALFEQNTDAQISLIAHSFGSYIISEILKSETQIQFHRLLLCGSIVSERFPWQQMKPKFVSGAIANDVGIRDLWPLIASKLGLGYGPSGRYGFKNVAVADNFHDCGHSGFFNPEHYIKFWVPFLSDGQVVDSGLVRE